MSLIKGLASFFGEYKKSLSTPVVEKGDTKIPEFTLSYIPSLAEVLSTHISNFHHLDGVGEQLAGFKYNNTLFFARIQQYWFKKENGTLGRTTAMRTVSTSTNRYDVLLFIPSGFGENLDGEMDVCFELKADGIYLIHRRKIWNGDFFKDVKIEKEWLLVDKNKLTTL